MYEALAAHIYRNSIKYNHVEKFICKTILETLKYTFITNFLYRFKNRTVFIYDKMVAWLKVN